MLDTIFLYPTAHHSYMKIIEHQLILKYARSCIEAAFTHQKVDKTGIIALTQRCGAFVTLTKDGELRGCIGYIEPIFPLDKLIESAALSAAFRDPRFPPLVQSELTDIKIEISLLTPKELIKVKMHKEYLQSIRIGRDGLILDGPYGSGLLLPQVAVEHRMNVQEFLECLSQKAGLDKAAYKDLKNKIYKFQAEIFSEETTERKRW
jgi:uncharacterized protein